MKAESTSRSRAVRWCLAATTVGSALTIGVHYSDGFVVAKSDAPLSILASSAESGTLYVVDPSRSAKRSQVLAVDISSASVRRRFEADYQPDAAVSPDGRRLYITSSVWDASRSNWIHTLKTYDAESGSLVAQADNPDDILVTMDRYKSKMTMSRSGRLIYIFKNHQAANDEPYLALFDTTRNDFLPTRIDLFGCLDALVMLGRQEFQVRVVCGHQSLVRDITIGAEGRDLGPVVDASVSVHGGKQRIEHDGGVVVPNPTTGALTFLSSGGQGTHLDLVTKTRSPMTTEARPGRWTGTQAALRRGDAAFFATGSTATLRSGSNSSDEIVKIDGNTGATRMTVTIGTPFFSMTMSPDGGTISMPCRRKTRC